MNRTFMTTRAGCVFVGILGGVLFAFTIRGTAQVELPEGPNRDLVERKCGFNGKVRPRPRFAPQISAEVSADPKCVTRFTVQVRAEGRIYAEMFREAF